MSTQLLPKFTFFFTTTPAMRRVAYYLATDLCDADPKIVAQAFRGPLSDALASMIPSELSMNIDWLNPEAAQKPIPFGATTCTVADLVDELTEAVGRVAGGTWLGTLEAELITQDILQDWKLLFWDTTQGFWLNAVRSHEQLRGIPDRAFFLKDVSTPPRLDVADPIDHLVFADPTNRQEVLASFLRHLEDTK